MTIESDKNTDMQVTVAAQNIQSAVGNETEIQEVMDSLAEFVQKNENEIAAYSHKGNILDRLALFVR